MKSLVFLIFVIFSSKLFAFMPITTDSRIKTIIYSPTEIFKLKFHRHFQSYIEFPQDEKFKVISIGDNYSFDVKQVENRLFVRPKMSGSLTNMTIITSKRAYHFELHSSKEDINETDAELVYVAKFYYPDTAYDYMQSIRLKKPLQEYKLDKVEEGQPRKMIAPITNNAKNNILHKGNLPGREMLFSAQSDQLKPPSLVPANHTPQNGRLGSDVLYNYAYSMSGSESDIMPVKVFDDGINTYFEFNASTLPDIYIVTEDNKLVLANYVVDGGVVIVNKVGKVFMLMDNINKICVFNDQAGSKPTNKDINIQDNLSMEDDFSYMK